MSEWAVRPLTEVADIIMGQSPGGDSCNHEGNGLPFLQGCGDFGDQHPMTSVYCTTPLRSAKSPSVLISVRAPVGTMNVSDQTYCIGRGLAAFTAKPDQADNTFLLHAVEHNLAYLHRRSQGSTFAAVSSADLRSVPIPKIDIDAQQRIAAVFRTVNTTITQTEALIAKYQQIKAGLMHDLFTRGVLPNGQLRRPREQAPHLYKQTELGWVPLEWEIAGMASKGRPGSHWIRTGPFGSSLKGEHWRQEGHPVITIGALGEGKFIQSELLHVGKRDAMRLADFQLSTGDVVFSRVADVGRSVVIREAQQGWIMSSNLMRIALDATLVRPAYLQMQLAGDTRIKRQIRSRVNSGGRDVANSEVLNQLRFAWPPIAEQDRIIARADQHNARLESEQETVAKLQRQKLGLMQDLLTGKVQVPAAQG